MTDKVSCEIYIAMNEDGGWIVTSDEGDALGQLVENEGGYQARVAKVTVNMAPPSMTEIMLNVPDDIGTTIETKATE